MLHKKVYELERDFETALKTINILNNEIKIINKEKMALENRVNNLKSKVNHYKVISKELLESKRILNTLSKCENDKLKIAGLKLYNRMKGI